MLKAVSPAPAAKKARPAAVIYATAQKAEIKAKNPTLDKKALENFVLDNGVACRPMKEKFGRTKQLLRRKPLKKKMQ